LAGPAAIADLANLAAQENRGVIEYLSIVRSVLVHAMNTEAAKGNAYATERVAGRLLETLRDLGRITGEVSELARTSISITNNSAVVMNSPLVAEMQSELLLALQLFPEARAAVIAAFVRLDERHGQGGDAKLIESRALEAAE